MLRQQQASLNDKFEIPLCPARLLTIVNHRTTKGCHKASKVSNIFSSHMSHFSCSVHMHDIAKKRNVRSHRKRPQGERLHLKQQEVTGKQFLNFAWKDFEYTAAYAESSDQRRTICS